MNVYAVKRLTPSNQIIDVRVPASKSILNRAMLLAALSQGVVRLECGAFSADTRAFLRCLNAVGIQTEQDGEGVTVHGCGGDIPNKTARLNVESAGTAARFLTVALAFCGGDYTLDSSEQMRKRPMKELLDLLQTLGVCVEYLQEEGKFPFRLTSTGITAKSAAVDTEKSSQYASAILLSASALSFPFTLTLTGARTRGSYVQITLDMLDAFHVPYARNGNDVTVFPAQGAPNEVSIEPDLSGACYFYALSLLFRTKVRVYGVRSTCMQGDKKFLSILEEKGVRFTDTEKGLLADGSGVSSFSGFNVDMRDFSDQALTLSAIAPFATSPTVILNVGHIRLQECDRINAICENLNALGIPTTSNGNDVFITPAQIQGGTVRTFDDHRVAMAFALIGLKTGNVVIENPECCRKTFDTYFEILDKLTK